MGNYKNYPEILRESQDLLDEAQRKLTNLVRKDCIVETYFGYQGGPEIVYEGERYFIHHIMLTIADNFSLESTEGEKKLVVRLKEKIPVQELTKEWATNNVKNLIKDLLYVGIMFNDEEDTVDKSGKIIAGANLKNFI